MLLLFLVVYIYLLCFKCSCDCCLVLFLLTEGEVLLPAKALVIIYLLFEL